MCEEPALTISELSELVKYGTYTDEGEEWLAMHSAPLDGSVVLTLFDDGNYSDSFWSDNPICILGPRNGSYPAGWATGGADSDHNLPLDESSIIAWRHET